MSSPVAGAQAATPAYIIPTGPDTLAYWDDPNQTWQEVAYFPDSPGAFVDWVPYTTTGQSFAANAMTRDGDWTMIANKATTTRPAPQETGPEEDLLPAWTPATQNARATYTVYNEWTLSQGGWINQYGVDVVAGNTGMSHAVGLRINGVVQDTVTFIPNAAGAQWLDIAPILVASGAVVRVTLTVTQTSNNIVYWYQQAALFATAPTYCSLAQGSKDGAAAGTTAYGCHIMFVPGTFSPDWDVVAYSGGVGGGGGGGPITLTGDVTGSGTSTVPTTLATVNANVGTFQGLTVNAKGLVTAASNQGYVTGGPYLPLTGGTVSGPVTINANAFATNFFINNNATSNAMTVGFNNNNGAQVQLWGNASSGGGAFVVITGSGGANNLSLDTSGNLQINGWIGAANCYIKNPATNNVMVVGYSNSNGPGIQFWGNAAAGAGSMIFVGGASGNQTLSSNTDGSLQIYGANATKPGGGSWIAPSDRELKSEISDWKTGLAEVLRLNPVSYRYGNDAWNHEHCNHVGLDAEDGAAVIPEMGRTVSVPVGPAPHEGEPQPTTEAAALDHGPLLFALVNAVKELTARLEALEGAR